MVVNDDDDDRILLDGVVMCSSVQSIMVIAASERFLGLLKSDVEAAGHLPRVSLCSGASRCQLISMPSTIRALVRLWPSHQ